MRVKDYVRKYKDTPQYHVIMQTLEQDHFSIYEDTIYDEGSFDRMVEDINDIDYDDEIDYASGCSKIAVLYNEIVFKKTYSGYVDMDSEEEEAVAYDMDDPNSYDYSPDYCALEASVYAEAILEGLEDFFAEVVRVSNRVYAQERADHTLSGFFTVRDFGLTGRDIEEIRDEYGFDGKIPEYAIGWWFVNKTSAHLRAFANFLSDHNINDLHSSNIGVFNGAVKLFDYSGYNSGAEFTF